LIIFQGASLVPESLETGKLWSYLFKLSGVVYILATFWRLYKFDRLASSDDSPLCFFGIPSTLAAAVFAAYCVAFGPYFEAQVGLVFLLPLWGLLLSVLMNGNFPTLKVGIPEKKSLRILQAMGFLYLAVAIPTRQTAPGLFVLAVLVLFITIYYGRKNYLQPKEENSSEEITGV
jgi:phosphatidylserine synthase